jgi:hypothetical protein
MRLSTFIFTLLLAAAGTLFSQTPPVDTDGDGYLNISTLEELRYISENEEMWDKNLELDNDIDASETRNWNFGDHDDNPATPDSVMGWKPIGDYIVPEKIKGYSGHFQGNGFSIQRLFINRTNTGACGLFSFLDDGFVSRLKMTMCDVSGKDNVGGIAGVAYNSRIFNCDFSGELNCSSYSGGIVGSASSCLIFGNSSTGSIQSNGSGIGGIVGAAWSNYPSLISGCSFSGIISGKGDIIGGIAGSCASVKACTVKDAVIEGEFLVGGIAGGTSYMVNCICQAEIRGQNRISGLSSGNALFRKCVSLSTVSGDQDYDPISSDEDSKAIACFYDKGLPGADSARIGTGISLAEMKNQEMFEDSTWNFDFIWKMNNDGPDLAVDYSVMPQDSDGDGVFEITNLDNLIFWSETDFIPEEQYELVNDIDLSPTKDMNFGTGLLCISGITAIFDGKGHKLANYSVRQDYYPEVGLFGTILKKGEVKNLELPNVDIIGFTEASTIAYANDGIIENVNVSGFISTNNNSKHATGSGGIVFQNFGLIESTTFKGNLNSDYCGGISINNSNTISMSSVNAEIAATELAAGIAVNNYCEISRCYFIGSLSASDSAGIVAGIATEEQSSVINCYASATMDGFIKYGVSESDESNSTNFYNSDLAPDVTGGTPATTQELKTQSTFTSAGWDFDNIWGISPEINDGYPYLRANEAVAVVEEQEIADDLLVYPNPATDYITVKGKPGAKVSIYDITGHCVLKSRAGMIDVSALPAGAYMVRVGSSGTGDSCVFLKR